MTIDVKQIPAFLRSKIDAVFGWIYWLIVLALLVMFAATVVRELGWRHGLIPQIPPLTLLYLAGVAWLLKR